MYFYLNTSSHASNWRNNRKIHARKFLATPEGQAWLERKKAEEAELKNGRRVQKIYLIAANYKGPTRPARALTSSAKTGAAMLAQYCAK
ncbi:hypothetical protein AB3Y05_003070 [Klebsiella variicola]